MKCEWKQQPNYGSPTCYDTIQYIPEADGNGCWSQPVGFPGQFVSAESQSFPQLEMIWRLVEWWALNVAVISEPPNVGAAFEPWKIISIKYTVILHLRKLQQTELLTPIFLIFKRTHKLEIW